VQMSDRQV